MTFFGQFFDHGLDLVTKGGNGTVYVPLQADDPLIIVGRGWRRRHTAMKSDEPAHLQFMALTRATPTTVDGVTGQENTTTSFVDQNQTYTSHASHQVFLREYVNDALAGPSAPARCWTAAPRAARSPARSATGPRSRRRRSRCWASSLTDFDVHNVPLLLTDQYGKFIPASGPNAVMRR